MCSCMGLCFAGFCCGACGECSAVKSGPISRLPYLFLFICAGVFSIVMSLYGEESLDLVLYDATLCPIETCMGTGSVYRTSFCLFLFELLHIIIIGCGCVAFHWLFFALKLMAFIICLVLTFVLNTENSNQFFQAYANYFARFISAFYLIIQILILIVWSYESNDMLRYKVDTFNETHRNEDADEDESDGHCRNPWAWAFVFLTIACYVISFTFCGIFYHWFASEDGCSLHITLITITIVLCILNAVFSYIRSDGSFFVAAIISLYITFLLFAALSSTDGAHCNMLYTANQASLWIGYVISFLSIAYAALRADRIALLTYGHDDEESDSTIEMKKNSKNEYSAVDTMKDGSDVEELEEDIEHKKPLKETKQMLRKSHTFFHFILCLAACYFAMLFTNWAKSNQVNTKGNVALWVNIASQWLSTVLFWWTLVAPLLCPARFPNNNNNDD